MPKETRVLLAELRSRTSTCASNEVLVGPKPYLERIALSINAKKALPGYQSHQKRPLLLAIALLALFPYLGKSPGRLFAQDFSPPLKLSPTFLDPSREIIAEVDNGVAQSQILEQRLLDTEVRLRDLELLLSQNRESQLSPSIVVHRFQPPSGLPFPTVGPPQENEVVKGDLDKAVQKNSIGDAKQSDEVESIDEKPAEEKEPEKKWFEKYSVRGYTQLRFNEVLERESDSDAPQHIGDRSVSENQEFFLRRARLIFFGDVSEHMYIYLQPDFVITTPGSSDSTHFVQVRDWYSDLYIDETKIHRIRLGQSKIPFGWENMQSSSNRLPLDRADALNSAARNERDLGVFYYYTPEDAQDFFKSVVDDGLKGSGNYGMFAFGAYNGQGGSFLEQNDNLHLISRFTQPYTFCDGQKAEIGVQGYTGRYVVLSSPIRPLGVGPAVRPNGTLESGNNRGIRDERGAVTAVWYPQPWGFQAEWNVGRGPGLNLDQTAVEERSLYGGYLMTMYRYETQSRGIFIPFARWAYYKGGYKSERNAPFSSIDEWELGTEWQINKQMEFTSMYTLTDRTNTSALSGPGEVSYGQFDGSLVRFQFQINY